MSFEMMHAQRRDAQREAQPVGDARADQQRAGKPRTLRIGDAVEVGKRSAGLAQHRLGQRHHPTDVVARRELGHDAAVGFVHRHLRMQRMREQAANAVVQRQPGLVAGGFYAEYEQDRLSWRAASIACLRGTQRPAILMGFVISLCCQKE